MTARGTIPLIALVGIAAVGIIGFFLFSQSSTLKTSKGAQSTTTSSTPEQQPLGNFEFLDVSAGFAKLNALPSGKAVHIVVASSGTPDIRTHRPVKIEIWVDGQKVWEETVDELPITNGKTPNCRGANGCSIDGPVIKPEWKGKKIEVKAYGKNGDLLAKYSE
ncbi:hypothetical protein HYW40_01685 [Candidatus Curtissbacteria bacterium]|nr:hypothetical protein [Candidatus Curtissbacteria bacterium]